MQEAESPAFSLKRADADKIRSALMTRVALFREFFPEYTAFMQRTYGERAPTDLDSRLEAGYQKAD
jgi:hypothetical protein